MKPLKYVEQFNEFRRVASKLDLRGSYEHSTECAFESLTDWSLFHSLQEVEVWFEEARRKSEMITQPIPMRAMNGWVEDPETGAYSHESGDFFSIHGLRVTSNSRERSRGWDQPIVTQVGFDGGVLGLVRKRFEGIPHYLCEAKEEPGNYGKVQISPTLQATFANINQSHGGRKPRFSDLFINRDDYPGVTTLFDAWLAEDGGRLYNKRNRGVLIQVPDDMPLDIPAENFIWLSLYQIKSLAARDAWVNPHVRGILSHV